jgi:hypothetical protein
MEDMGDAGDFEAPKLSIETFLLKARGHMKSLITGFFLSRTYSSKMIPQVFGI